MGWPEVEAKFHDVARHRWDAPRREAVVETVRALPEHDVADLTARLA